MSADVSEAVERVRERLISEADRYEALVRMYPRDKDVPLWTEMATEFRRLPALQEGSGALSASPSGGQGSSPAAIPAESEGPSPGRWPSVEAFRDALWDFLESRAARCEATALTHVPKSPARHYARGRSSAFLSVASDLCNGPEWFASQLATAQAGMEARQSRNAPQPSPEPRDRVEGWRLKGEVARAIADGFSGGNEPYDEATEMQRERYDMAADAVLVALSPKNTESEHD